jgi:hypothetical protein
MAGSITSHVSPARRSAVNRANVAIAIAESARDRIYEIAAACRALGLEHTSTLTDVGVLLGSVELNHLLGLWAVPGVVAVELERGSRVSEPGVGAD